MKQLPGLLKQEKESFYCLLLINYKTYKMYKSINYSQVQKYLDNFIEYNFFYLFIYYFLKIPENQCI